MNLKGEVIIKKINIGSKSEHEAVMLQTANSAVKLRRPGGNPFKDDALVKYVGKKVTCKGDMITTISGNKFFMCIELKEISE